MTAPELIRQIAAMGGLLTVDGDRIRYELPAEGEPLVPELRRLRDDVIRELRPGSLETESMPLHDPAEWREPFNRWLKAACTVRRGCFGGVGLLHVAFCEWEVRNDGVPCTRATFETLLWESGCTVEHGLTELILKAWASDEARVKR